MILLFTCIFFIYRFFHPKKSFFSGFEKLEKSFINYNQYTSMFTYILIDNGENYDDY